MLIKCVILSCIFIFMYHHLLSQIQSGSPFSQSASISYAVLPEHNLVLEILYIFSVYNTEKGLQHVFSWQILYKKRPKPDQCVQHSLSPGHWFPTCLSNQLLLLCTCLPWNTKVFSECLHNTQLIVSYLCCFILLLHCYSAQLWQNGIFFPLECLMFSWWQKRKEIKPRRSGICHISQPINLNYYYLFKISALSNQLCRGLLNTDNCKSLKSS